MHIATKHQEASPLGNGSCVLSAQTLIRCARQPIRDVSYARKVTIGAAVHVAVVRETKGPIVTRCVQEAGVSMRFAPTVQNGPKNETLRGHVVSDGLYVSHCFEWVQISELE